MKLRDGAGELLEGKRVKATVRVSATVHELAGMNAYMRLEELNHLAREGLAVSTAGLLVDRSEQDALLERLKEIPAAAVVIVTRTLVDTFRATTARNVLFFTGILTAFAATIAIGVVYNNARIQLAERAWELASLRVLGFTRGEVGYILLGELGLVTVAAIPLGFLIGLGLVGYAAWEYGWIDRLVPAFLRAPEPLTHDAVLAGFAGLRPSAQAHRPEEPARRFLERMQPLAAELEDATDRLFAAFGRTLALIDPLQLEDVIGQIFAAVREQVHVIDPDALADSAQDLLDELTAPLATLDPAELAQRLGAAFDLAVAAIQQSIKEFLDDVAKAIDARLKVAREAVTQTLTEVRAAVRLAGEALGDVAEQFDQLVLVDLVPRFERVLDNLNTSFDRELDRTRAAFDAMLAASCAKGISLVAVPFIIRVQLEICVWNIGTGSVWPVMARTSLS